MNKAKLLKKIESNARGHFKFLPWIAGFNIKESENLTIINCGYNSSMFNIVYGGIAENDSDRVGEKIKGVIKEFRGKPFAWWIPPTLRTEELSKYLHQSGFVVEAEEHAMVLDLAKWQQKYKKEDIKISQVTNTAQLEHFLSVIDLYDATPRLLYKDKLLPQLQATEKMFVGYEGGFPVCIAIIFLDRDTAGIFSLVTKEEKRGRGYGTNMMRFLIENATKAGANYATLSASSDSGYRIYEKLGFEKVGQFECFEWKG